MPLADPYKMIIFCVTVSLDALPRLLLFSAYSTTVRTSVRSAVG
jgi:hypothetical protein